MAANYWIDQSEFVYTKPLHVSFYIMQAFKDGYAKGKGDAECQKKEQE